MTEQEKLDRYLLARLLYWRHAMIGLEDAAVAEILALLGQLKKEMGGVLLAEAERLGSITEWSQERLEALGNFCDEVLAGASLAMTGSIESAFVAAGIAANKFGNALISLDGAATGINTVGMSAEQLRSWLYATPLGGHLLQGWVDKALTSGIKENILRSFRKSGLKGEGYGPMVRKAIQAALDDGFNLTRREAITLARTYTQTANVEAQMAVYRANENIIRGYRWCSILDTGVCARCAALDGMTWRKDEPMPPIPLHPRCRCLLLPVMKVEDLKLSPAQLDPAARPWLRRELKNIDAGGTRKVLAAGTTQENFSGWWETLPEREQLFSMGPVRTKLLREGEIKFSDLVDKSTGRLRTLEELGFTESGKALDVPENPTISQLENMASARARHVVKENFYRKFPEWSKRPEGNLPIAVLSREDAEKIGAKGSVAVISADTIRKQQSHHPELTIDDYLNAQVAVDRGVKIIQDARNLAFVMDQAAGAVVIVKATADHKELYATSLRRMSTDKENREDVLRRLRNRKSKKTDGGA